MKTYQVRIGESLMVGDYESLEKADAARIRLEDLFGLPCSVSETGAGEGGKQERKPFGERLIDSMKRGLDGLAARESQVAVPRVWYVNQLTTRAGGHMPMLAIQRSDPFRELCRFGYWSPKLGDDLSLKACQAEMQAAETIVAELNRLEHELAKAKADHIVDADKMVPRDAESDPLHPSYSGEYVWNPSDFRCSPGWIGALYNKGRIYLNIGRGLWFYGSTELHPGDKLVLNNGVVHVETIMDKLIELNEKTSETPTSAITVPRDAEGKEWRVGDECEWTDSDGRSVVGRLGEWTGDRLNITSMDGKKVVHVILNWRYFFNLHPTLRRPQPSPAPAPAIKPFGQLAVGDKVKARWDNGDDFGNAVVVGIRTTITLGQSDGNFDGDEFGPDEYGPDKFFYAPASDPAPTPKPVAFADLKVGDVVQWRLHKEHRWQTGTAAQWGKYHQDDPLALCVTGADMVFYADNFGPDLYLRAPVERWVRADKGDFIFADNVPEWVIGHAMKALLGKDVSSYPFEVGDALLLWPDGTVTCQKKETPNAQA